MASEATSDDGVTGKYAVRCGVSKAFSTTTAGDLVDLVLAVGD